jgi:hypothetical protein
MISFQALDHYSFLTNFLVGLLFFAAVFSVGDFLVRGLYLQLSSPLRQISKIILGFLVLSLVIQLLSFGFWITAYSLLGINVLLGISLLLYLYRHLPRLASTLSEAIKKLWKEDKFSIAGVGFSFFPLLVYAVLPSTKIDELFYHQLVAQRIVMDGGLVFYRQPWEAAIPPHLIYNFTHAPLVALGFPDAPNVVSLGIFTLFLGSVYILLKKAHVSAVWIAIALCLSCLGMYRLVFTTAGSHHFGDLAAFAALYCTLRVLSLHKENSVQSIAAVQGIVLPALLGAKMSLAPFAALVGLVMFYELYQRKELHLKTLLFLFLPTFIFYLPIVSWTYFQTHSPFGLILSQYFDTQLIDRHLLESTLQAEVVTTPTFLEHLRAALLHFPYLLLGSFALFFFSNYSIAAKIKIYGICLIYLFILYKFHLLYNPRFWANIPLSLFLLSLLSPAPSWPKTRVFLSNKISMTFLAIATMAPYLAISYFYLYYLRPFPYNTATREAYYKKYIPLYEDYRILNKLLPKDACLYTKNRISLVHSPRRIFRDSLDICRCGSIYTLQFDTDSLSYPIRIQHSDYLISKLIYQNRRAVLEIYRTPNKYPKTSTLSIYKLSKAIP